MRHRCHRLPAGLSMLLMPMLALLALPAAARIAHYELDPVHTRVLFTCNHFGYSNALGTFSRPTGTLS